MAVAMLDAFDVFDNQLGTPAAAKFIHIEPVSNTAFITLARAGQLGLVERDGIDTTLIIRGN